MIELKNISKQYCKETTILKDIDLCIEDGDYIALMGPSGAGKTTLMNIMGCLDRATQGEYFLDGNEISDYPEKEKARLRNEKFGFVVQDFALINEMTVYENVRLPLRYSRKRLKEERIYKRFRDRRQKRNKGLRFIRRTAAKSSDSKSNREFT